MKKIALILIAFSVKTLIYCQNLILNGSFEDLNTCSEFHAQCAPVAWKTLNLAQDNFIKTYGREGLGIAFILQKSNSVDYRSYVKTRLLCPLLKDSTYQISFYLKTDLSYAPSLGLFFSMDEIFSQNSKRLILKPNIAITEEGLSEKYQKKTWQKYTYSYTAKGYESHVLIGNFEADQEDAISWKDKETLLLCQIDDFTIVAATTNAQPCAELEPTKQEIIADNERHTAHNTLLKRLDFKKSYDLLTNYRPIDGLSKNITPCAGDQWEGEYRIDTFKISNTLLADDLSSEVVFSQLNSTLDTKKAMCIGITISISADTSNAFFIKKAYEIGILIAKIFKIEKSNICVKIELPQKQNLIFSFDTDNKEEIENKIEVLFLMSKD